MKLSVFLQRVPVNDLVYICNHFRVVEVDIADTIEHACDANSLINLCTSSSPMLSTMMHLSME